MRNKYDEFIYAFGAYICNEVLNEIPSHSIRILIYKIFFRISIGKFSSIGMHTVLVHHSGIYIGSNCAIGQNALLDGRGNLTIGKNVNISRNVQILTGTHKVDDPLWSYFTKPVLIENDCWIATGALILPGVIIKRGAVVAAGAVVTKNVEEFTIVGGNPARKIGNRMTNIKYLTDYFPLFQ